MAQGIRQLHFDTAFPGIADPRLARCKFVAAIWPAPVDADECFAAAGFHDFADSDDTWDRDWRRIVTRVLQELEKVGTAKINIGAEVYQTSRASFPSCVFGWLFPGTKPSNKVPLSLIEQIFVVTSDDRFGEVLVEFGEPVLSTLLVGNGHPILWIGWNSSDAQPEVFVERVAAGIPTARTTLDWQKLLPSARRIYHAQDGSNANLSP